MSSWVRYCIAVYFGLLLSGALAQPPWTRGYPAAYDSTPVSRDAAAPAPPGQPSPCPADAEPGDRSA